MKKIFKPILSAVGSGLFRVKPLSRHIANSRPPAASARHETSAPSRYRVETLEPRILLSGDSSLLAPLITGAIDAPGETKPYVFTLDTDTKVIFDSLTPNSGLDWSLAGPGGAITTQASISTSSGVMNLQAGQYTLNVDGTGSATGNYSFRLINLGQAATINVGAPVTDQFSATDDINAYQFTARIGDQIQFQPQQINGGDASWYILDSRGDIAGSGSTLTGTPQTISLASTGTYTLVMQATGGATGLAVPLPYSFVIAPEGNIPFTLPQGTAINLDSEVDGYLANSAQQDVYNFSLTRQTLINVQSLEYSSSPISFQVLDANGAVAGGSLQGFGQNASSDFVSLAAGNYAIVLGSTEAGINFAFQVSRYRLLRVAR